MINSHTVPPTHAMDSSLGNQTWRLIHSIRYMSMSIHSLLQLNPSITHTSHMKHTLLQPPHPKHQLSCPLKFILRLYCTGPFMTHCNMKTLCCSPALRMLRDHKYILAQTLLGHRVSQGCQPQRSSILSWIRLGHRWARMGPTVDGVITLAIIMKRRTGYYFCHRPEMTCSPRYDYQWYLLSGEQSTGLK